ncbi:cytochrome c biogenesis protein [Pseudobdellovibrio sp. HCB154]|uniref:cytochrome c biogenesis protein n=1 Tax=Pseudobdellovibrio sp. HCB154 TaxID=3386277 RepID=UPI00391700B5
MIRLIFAVLVTLQVSLFSQIAKAEPKLGEAIRYMPVQDGGRIKPYDTFAKEVLEVVYGKQKYKTESGESAPAYLIVLTWMLSPDSWVNRPLFEVNHLDVKNKLGLPKDQKYFSNNELFTTDKFQNLMQELADKRQSQEKLTPYFQALQRLQNQMIYFRELAGGRLLKIMPSPVSETWLSVAEIPETQQGLFVNISQSVAAYLGALAEHKDVEGAKATLDKAVVDFQKSVEQVAPEKYAQAHKVGTEVFYNDLHPFRWTYVLYILASIILLFIWIRNLQSGMGLVWTITLAGFFIHILGFAFRVYLAERPPVTNMYETVVWVSWGVMLFSMILEKIYKYRIFLLAGLLVGFVCMVIADTAPAVLDPSIQPLEAVLRSSYWLIVHVMTITISYAAFALAFGLGDIGLIYYAIDKDKHAEKIKHITTGVYRAMQIGVAFLAPGIILGGVWADASWGRFWGWDPKETWALIALLGYIIILHTRLVNWIQNFGMLVAAVLTFNLVIMAWYGVNFVLGAGLHSYGFGAGGVEYVSIFVLLHFIFVGYVFSVKKLSKV